MVTHIENMHATKADLAYYREILSVLELEPRSCLMVGDDWLRDMVPAAGAGIPVYWVTVREGSGPGLRESGGSQVPGDLLIGSGPLGDVLSALPSI